jgi:hypothetical protein
MGLLLPATLAALPWLQGFFAPTGATETASQDAVEELAEWRQPDAACIGTLYGGLSLTADVAAGEGEERVLASYTQGLVVLDRENHLIAQAPGFPCEGSADELVALAAGDGGVGTPIVALAATSGGHAESATVLTLYRVANSGELQPVFIGEVERHADHTTQTGTVTLIPGGLVYRDTSGTLSLWVYDTELGRYVQQLSTRPMV